MVVKEGLDVVAAAKKNNAGKSLPEQRHQEDITIGSLLNSMPAAPADGPRLDILKPSRESPSKARKARSEHCRKCIQQHMGKYDAIGDLSNTSSGLIFWSTDVQRGQGG